MKRKLRKIKKHSSNYMILILKNLKQDLGKKIKNAVAKLDEPWKNLTVKDVAKDLKMGENLANELFKRKDFPSVNIGKTKTISKIAYELWKLEKREPEYRKKRGY